MAWNEYWIVSSFNNYYYSFKFSILPLLHCYAMSHCTFRSLHSDTSKLILAVGPQSIAIYKVHHPRALFSGATDSISSTIDNYYNSQ